MTFERITQKMVMMLIRAKRLRPPGGGLGLEGFITDDRVLNCWERQSLKGELSYLIRGTGLLSAEKSVWQRAGWRMWMANQ